MAQQQPVRTTPHRWVADGHYAAGDGTAWRWYVEALPDLMPPLLLQTLQGWCGADLVTVQAEIADASRATACAAIDGLITARAIKAGRKVARTVLPQPGVG